VAFANELGAEPVTPGTARYSNTNYALVGLIVEAATGTSLGAQMQQRIFGPLELGATSYPSTPELESPFAHGYMELGAPPAADVTGLSPTMAGPGGAVVSTAADVATFYRALFGGELLSPGLLGTMMETLPGEHGALGYGLQTRVESCGTFYGHGGNFPGYLMFAWSSPSGDRQAVVGMNMDPRSLPTADAEITTLVSDALCGPGPSAEAG
jgi:D-alanyl-D-alanine carboxypeptidase